MYREQKKGKNVPPKSGRETGNGRIDRALRREMRG
jgi:hypothetical protein